MSLTSTCLCVSEWSCYGSIYVHVCAGQENVFCCLITDSHLENKKVISTLHSAVFWSICFQTDIKLHTGGVFLLMLWELLSWGLWWRLSVMLVCGGLLVLWTTAQITPIPLEMEMRGCKIVIMCYLSLSRSIFFSSSLSLSLSLYVMKE